MMKYYHNLLSSKTPSKLQLIDIALTLAILPHLFLLKTFMILYLLLSLYFVTKATHAKSDLYILLSFGIVAIFISQFTTYNFSDFSKMQFFVSLVINLLLLALTLQRATRTISFYLIISPALLLMLSFFFFDTIIMLFYSVVTFFLFTLLSIWSKMNTTLLDVTKFTAKVFLLATPGVVVLFLVFPRISFDKADFGFRADDYLTTGYSGFMEVSDKEVIPSNRLIAEVYFDDNIPSTDALYFRGTTLYTKNGISWGPALPQQESDILLRPKHKVNYTITLYPHAKKWIYTLDLINMTPPKTKLLPNYTLQALKPIYRATRYKLSSTLQYTLHAKNNHFSLYKDQNSNTKTLHALESLHKQNLTHKEKAKKLIKFFYDQNLSYTTKPSKLSKKDTTDSFLFDTKNGYCTHFASAFALSAMALDIPARVVTGYKANGKNLIDNYLIIKASDAHAWVELYLGDEGWVRFEPTATAQRDLDFLEQQTDTFILLSKLNNYFMYIKYILQEWILDYDRSKQLELLKELLNDTWYLVKFILSFLLFCLVSWLLYLLLQKNKTQHVTTQALQPLLKKLRSLEITKKEDETMAHFFHKAERKLGISFENINTLYHKQRYSQTPLNPDQLKDEVNIVLKKLSQSKNYS